MFRTSSTRSAALRLRPNGPIQDKDYDGIEPEGIMEQVKLDQASRIDRFHHWVLFVAGVLLFCTGPVLYVIQFRLKNLGAPWYVPTLASAGATLMIVSVWRRWGVPRTLVAAVFALVCAFEWFAFLVATRSPVYAGPAHPGAKVSAFTTTLADGKPFTEKDLEEGTSTVLVFYRGRW
jgi:hypothetical protein